MKRYLKFAASFWMSAFLMTGSMASAQNTPTTKAKKKPGSSSTNSAPAAVSNNSGQPQSDTATPSAQPAAVANPEGTPAATPNVTKPKTMIGPDKQTIPVPQQ